MDRAPRPLEKTFFAVSEERPGADWQRRAQAAWPMAKAWYLKEGLGPRPTPAEGRAAIAGHMPEMVPIYDRLCELAGPDEVAHRMLTQYNPPPVIGGCQAVWTGESGRYTHRYEHASVHGLAASR